jgi:class 3 adenylate cyclase
MAFSAQHFSADQVFPLSLEQVWDLLSNTEHLNRTIGLPAVNYSSPIPQDGFYRTASAKLFKIFSLNWKEYPFEWVRNAQYKEYPFEWIRNERYAVLRVFEGGVLERFFGGVELHPEGEGTHVRVFADLTPRNLLGRLIIPLIGQKGVQDTLAYCTKFLELTKSKAEDSLPRSSQGSRASVVVLDNLLAKLDKAPVQKALIPRLRYRLIEGTDDEVLRMKPFTLARVWKVDSHEVLRLFLYATKVGILNLNWELMCPNCRVAKAEYGTLTQVSSRFHCDACGVDYEANLDKYVELRFSVHPTIRKAECAIYCIGGPVNTPHILAQQYLPPGTERELFLTLENEDLRIRAFRYNQTVNLEGTSEKPEDLNLVYRDEGWGPTSIAYKPGNVRLCFRNKSSKILVAILEKVRWDPYAVTAAQVTAFQEFRDLFSSEVLAPGQQVSIENLSIFFTDLKGSTSLYEEVGEASAFNRVRSHFEFLIERIKQNHGAIVKTIGDAVMAVFSTPEGAVHAALEIQSEAMDFNRSHNFDPPLIIKIGVHHGPAIAVNANDHLDYFGRTVNIAARVQRESTGGDVVLSEELFQSPAVQKALQEFQFKTTSFQASLKGIEGTFTLYRLRPFPI